MIPIDQGDERIRDCFNCIDGTKPPAACRRCTACIDDDARPNWFPKDGAEREYRSWLPILSAAQPVAQEAIPPIERDESMDRTYIPLPGGWEVQTQGKGSTFRICNTKTGDRWPVLCKDIHAALEQMARDAHAAALAAPQPSQAAEIASLLTRMFASAIAHVRGQDDEVHAYTVKTGALHRIVGTLQGAGHTVIIPANMTTAHETAIGLLAGVSGGAAPHPPVSADAGKGVEPVAVVGKDWQLFYAGGDAISDIVKRHGLKIGSHLYCHPSEPAAVSGEVSDAVNALRRLERAVDLHLGRSSWTQTSNLKGMGYSEQVHKELFAAHDEARAVLALAGSGEKA